MLEARPGVLRLIKRTLDTALEAVSVDAAMDIEERAQMVTIARR